MEYGYIKVASAVPAIKVADCKYNAQQVLSLIEQAEKSNVEIIVFPELVITGYTCQDLFRQNLLLKTAEDSVRTLLGQTEKYDVISIIGAPILISNKIYNAAVVIQKGEILGLVLKNDLPNYGEFYEKRWFSPASEVSEEELTYAGQKVLVTPSLQIFETSSQVKFGVEICEDLWAPIPQSSLLATEGAELVFNLSASNELIGKHLYVKKMIESHSARTITGYIYSGSGYGESTQDLVFTGNSFIVEVGEVLSEGDRFLMSPSLLVSQIDIDKIRAERSYNTTFCQQEKMKSGEVHRILCKPIPVKTEKLSRKISPNPFIPDGQSLDETCNEAFNIQVMGLIKRMTHTSINKVVLGISGGLDSTLALLVCVKAFDKLSIPRQNIVGVTMPGFGTSDRTYYNALNLMKNLGITIREISIKDSVILHFKDIEHDENIHDITYENSQARERTQILMDLSNQINALVIGTGDLSELALGWATYNGDHMSMYGVNASIPKTLIQYLVKYVATNEFRKSNVKDLLLDILDTPISPELVPLENKKEASQKTEEIVGPYELHDFFIYYCLRYSFSPKKIFLLAQQAFGNKYTDEIIKHWLKVFFVRFFRQQFKRSCLPDGPKVSSVSLSPRGDWRMPTDASMNMWMEEIDDIKLS